MFLSPFDDLWTVLHKLVSTLFTMKTCRLGFTLLCGNKDWSFNRYHWTVRCFNILFLIKVRIIEINKFLKMFSWNYLHSFYYNSLFKYLIISVKLDVCSNIRRYREEISTKSQWKSANNHFQSFWYDGFYCPWATSLPYIPIYSTLEVNAFPTSLVIFIYSNSLFIILVCACGAFVTGFAFVVPKLGKFILKVKCQELKFIMFWWIKTYS